jgi:hypothetical protein
VGQRERSLSHSSTAISRTSQRITPMPLARTRWLAASASGAGIQTGVSCRSASLLEGLAGLDAAARELVVAVPRAEQQQIGPAEQHAADRGAFDHRADGEVRRAERAEVHRTMLA